MLRWVLVAVSLAAQAAASQAVPDGSPLKPLCGLVCGAWEPEEIDVLHREGDSVPVGTFTLTGIHTTGHCPGSVCLAEPKEGVLVSGDTLFHETIGTLSIPTAQPERMWQSLERLAKLPGATQVYPGHGRPTTIEAEPWLPRARALFGRQ